MGHQPLYKYTREGSNFILTRMFTFKQNQVPDSEYSISR